MEWSKRALGLTTLCGAACFAVGCGDITDSVGKQGRLRFAIGTSYEVKADELSEATIVAGHRQQLDVDLTAKGEDDIEEPSDVTYRMKPSEGVEVATEDAAKGSIPDVEVRVSDAGEYSLEAVYKGRVVDSIDLTFAKSDAVEILARLRAPYADDFEELEPEGRVSVEEGAQATFLPIPKKGKERLVGEIEADVKATPKELVVPGEGAGLVYEQAVWSVEGNIDFYFIEPGDVSITITDPVSGASGTFDFSVEPRSTSTP